jgi:glucose/arabinose dehydrogenase
MIRGPWTRALVVSSVIVAGCGGGGGSPAPSPPGGTVGETITGRERIGWDQVAASASELATLRYAIYVDGTRTEITDVSCAATAGPAGFACSGRLPPMSNGTHTLEIASFREAGGLVESSRSAPLRVTVAGAEAPPGAAGLIAGEVVVTDDGVRLTAEPLLTGLDEPTDIQVAADGRIFIVDDRGRLHIVSDRSALEVLQLQETLGHGGLLSIALAPDFSSSGHIYVLAGMAGAEGNAFRVLRYRAAEGTLVDRMVVLPDVPASAHPAGRLRFGPDGRLYVAFDNGDSDERAVRLADWSGKILRFEPDGRTPADQPAASPVLWSGVRVPRGMAWAADGTLWTAEDGVDGVERLRAIDVQPGAVRRAGSRQTYALPRPFGGRALTVHPGGSLPAFSGDLLLASGDAGYLLRISLDAEARTRASRTEKLLEGRAQTLRAVATDRDGSIYFCTADALWRLTAAAPLPGQGSR